MMKSFSKGSNTYWPHNDGHFSISDEGGWLPGAFENEEAADLGHELKHMENWGLLQRLQNEANQRSGGTGGVITVADLKMPAINPTK